MPTATGEKNIPAVFVQRLSMFKLCFFGPFFCVNTRWRQVSSPARITAAQSFIHDRVTTEVDSIVLTVRTTRNNCRTILIANSRKDFTLFHCFV